jgi:hypothetical protein
LRPNTPRLATRPWRLLSGKESAMKKAGGVKSRPFDYIKPSLAFFDDDVGMAEECVDLMGFSSGEDEDDSFGMIDHIAQFAREILGNATSASVRATLQFADSTLDVLLDGRLKISVGKSPVQREQLDFKKLNQLDFIHIMIDLFDEVTVVMMSDDSATADRIEVTPARFCAAYALRMLYNATRPYLCDSGLREYYLMQAATTYGLMHSLVPRAISPASQAVQSALRKAVARSGANAMLAKDPKHAAMKDIRREFDRWQAHTAQYPNDAAFAKAMHARHAEVLKNEGSIKNACTRWRKAQKSSS